MSWRVCSGCCAAACNRRGPARLCAGAGRCSPWWIVCRALTQISGSCTCCRALTSSRYAHVQKACAGGNGTLGREAWAGHRGPCGM